MATPAKTLDAVKSLPPGLDRLTAAVEYVRRAEQAATDGRRVRDEEIRRLVAEHGPARTRDLTGLTLATIKSVSRGTSPG